MAAGNTRIDGCNHIKCLCGTDFYYVCGEAYSSGFFSCGHRNFHANFERTWSFRVPPALRAELVPISHPAPIRQWYRSRLACRLFGPGPRLSRGRHGVAHSPEGLTLIPNQKKNIPTMTQKTINLNLNNYPCFTCVSNILIGHFSPPDGFRRIHKRRLNRSSDEEHAHLRRLAAHSSPDAFWSIPDAMSWPPFVTWDTTKPLLPSCGIHGSVGAHRPSASRNRRRRTEHLAHAFSLCYSLATPDTMTLLKPDAISVWP
ncbi:hypothetical protein G6O67_005380 [Ophiocordyceps sinensis]|uniref:Uncharacterized protein n=1 Tax=Ophiocordyceps sinensis TaxID=72228 RepID=A0A8H4V5V7_9HYPO|nr:hypothetical protein G6O67_005380 [Ophiocordyceps sinensis]